jgi:hypothetical protein
VYLRVLHLGLSGTLSYAIFVYLYFCISFFDTWEYHFWNPWTTLFSKIYHMWGLSGTLSYGVFVYLHASHLWTLSHFQKYNTCRVKLQNWPKLYLCICLFVYFVPQDQGLANHRNLGFCQLKVLNLAKSLPKKVKVGFWVALASQPFGKKCNPFSATFSYGRSKWPKTVNFVFQWEIWEFQQTPKQQWFFCDASYGPKISKSVDFEQQ